jgi:hypothetical protein
MSPRNLDHRPDPLPEPEELTPRERSEVLAFLCGIDTRMSAGSNVDLDESEAKRIVRSIAKRLHERKRKQR